MPKDIIHALAYLKKAAPLPTRCWSIAKGIRLIGQVCDEILAGKLDAWFPLVVWQTAAAPRAI